MFFPGLAVLGLSHLGQFDVLGNTEQQATTSLTLEQPPPLRDAFLSCLVKCVEASHKCGVGPDSGSGLVINSVVLAGPRRRPHQSTLLINNPEPEFGPTPIRAMLPHVLVEAKECIAQGGGWAGEWAPSTHVLGPQPLWPTQRFLSRFSE